MSESPPAVTVLMSVRDGARHLRSAMASILEQTFSDFEFLILDDGSDDDSRSIVASHDDPRIRMVVNDENLGLARSLNRGISLARGGAIARMDADDLSSPERLARQVAHLASHPRCGLVATWACVIDDDDREIGALRTPVDPGALRRELLRGNCITHGSVMIRTDALRRVGGYDPAMERSQDYDLWLRLLDECELACLPEALYSWRAHPGGISGRHGDDQDAFAARARGDALRRRVERVVGAVARGELARGPAAARLADCMREHEEAHAPRRSPLVVPDRLWWRLPWLRRRAFARRRRDRLDEVAVVLALCADGAVPPEQACDELVRLVEAVADAPGAVTAAA